MTRHLLRSSVAGVVGAAAVCVVVVLDAVWKDREARRRAALYDHYDQVGAR